MPANTNASTKRVRVRRVNEKPFLWCDLCLCLRPVFSDGAAVAGA